jgi:hypothetical protein
VADRDDLGVLGATGYEHKAGEGGDQPVALVAVAVRSTGSMCFRLKSPS